MSRANKLDSLIGQYYERSQADTSSLNTLKKIIAEYLNRDENSDSALIWIKKLESKSAATNNRELGVDASIYQGKYYLKREEFALALEAFYKALQNSRNYKYNFGIGNAYLQIGVLLFTQKQYKDAIENFTYSLKEFETLNDTYRVSMLTYLIGNTQIELSDFYAARSNLEKAIKLKTALHDRQGELECNIALAKLLFQTNELSAAQKLYYQCLSTVKQDGISEGVVIINIGLSKILILQDSLQKAETLLIEALGICERLNFVYRKVAVLNELKNFYQLTKSYETAFTYQAEYYTLKDSIYNFDNSKTIAALKSKIEADKKQAEIEALQHKEKVAGIQRIFGGAVIFFLLAYLYNLYKRFSFKKKAEEKLANTNKDLERTIINLKTTEEELIHAEKMASMGRLTSGIAHELRNPLNFVANFSKLSEELISEISNGHSEEERMDAARQLKNNLSLIQTHSNRADNIIRSMLQLSRKSSTERTPEFLNKLVEEFTKVAYKNYTEAHHSFRCHIEFSFDDHIKLVQMNSHEITGVILSLMHNAFDSMEERKLEEPGYEPELRVSTRLDHDRAFVYVTDNGKGIPENMHQKIFEPFFSTKPIEKGTGLGLSLCYDFIKIHQGGITATSNGKQTTLTFFLPVNSSVVSGNIDYSKITNYKN